jgi:hypothetical protein
VSMSLFRYFVIIFCCETSMLRFMPVKRFKNQRPARTPPGVTCQLDKAQGGRLKMGEGPDGRD